MRGRTITRRPNLHLSHVHLTLRETVDTESTLSMNPTKPRPPAPRTNKLTKIPSCRSSRLRCPASTRIKTEYIVPKMGNSMLSSVSHFWPKHRRPIAFHMHAGTHKQTTVPNNKHTDCQFIYQTEQTQVDVSTPTTILREISVGDIKYASSANQPKK